jgi:hypothetical protein
MASATSLPKQAWQREVMDNNTHAYVEDMKNSNT